MKIEFVTASHDLRVLNANLKRSIIFDKYPLIVKTGYDNVGRAYFPAQWDPKLGIHVT